MRGRPAGQDSTPAYVFYASCGVSFGRAPAARPPGEALGGRPQWTCRLRVADVSGRQIGRARAHELEGPGARPGVRIGPAVGRGQGALVEGPGRGAVRIG